MEPVFLSKIDFDDLGHVEATGEHLFEANGVEEAIIVARAGTFTFIRISSELIWFRCWVTR